MMNGSRGQTGRNFSGTISVVICGLLAASPIKNLSLPKLARRLPKFLTAQQMTDLLSAPLKLVPPPGQKASAKPNVALLCRRDTAILETIYSCGLRISELCGLKAQ